MRFFALIFLFLSTSFIFAQPARDADRLFNERKYEQAQVIYKKLLGGSPSNVLYQYRYARCCYELGDAATAIRYFEEAGDRYPLRNFYLGNLYFDAYRFEEAIVAWQEYMKSLAEDDERLPILARRIETAELGVRFLARVEDITIVDSIKAPKKNFLDYYRLSPETGKLEARNTFQDGVLQQLVSYTNQRKDRTIFSDVNDGRLDMFRTLRLLDDWSSPKPLPVPPNTKYNENYPFVMSDGITFYFASDSPEGMGGYDIYITRYNSETETYLQPENIGMPFNSPANDYMLVLDESRHLGWFATDRRQHADTVMIYVFIPNEATKVVRHPDARHVADLAALKTYRTAARPDLPDQTVISTVGQTDAQTGFSFFINDNIVYRHYADFQSRKAEMLFRQYQQAEKKYEEQNARLVELRRTYELAQAGQKKAMADSIISLEQQLQKQQYVLESQIINVRNTEIEYLQVQQK